MKKLLTKEQKNKKKQRNQLVIGIILIFLMLFSTAGYALGNGSDNKTESIEYNNIKFTRSGGYWNFNLNGKIFTTLHNPKEVSNIPIMITNSVEDYKQKPLYFVGEIREPSYEILRNLNSYVLRVNPACLSELECTDNSPIKNISTDNIIIIQEPLENQKENIYQQEKAIFITASFENQTKYADALLFNLLGI